jgi:hypothetical protein
LLDSCHKQTFTRLRARVARSPIGPLGADRLRGDRLLIPSAPVHPL